jgi:outer membrane protein TolC
MTIALDTNVVDISDHIDLVAALAEARATLAAAKKAEDDAKRKLAALVGAGVGTIDGVPVIAVTNVEAERLNIKGLQAALPEIAAEYTITYSYATVRVLP